jgi:hypothetical protein
MIERIWRDMFKLTNWGKKIILNTKELLEIKQELESYWIELPTDEILGK